MPARHHRLTRAGSAVVTVATALVTTAGLASPLVAPAYAVTTGVTIAAPDADVDRRITVVASGRLGVLYQQEGTDGYVWSSSRKAVPALNGVPAQSILDTYDYDNRVFYSTTADDGSITVTAYNLETGYTYSFKLPSGYQNPQMSGGFALVSHQLADGTHEYRVLRPNGSGGSYDVQVQLPDGATAEAEPRILATADGGTEFVVRYQKDGRAGYGIVNGLSGTVTALQVTGPASSFRLTRSWVSWYTREDGAGIRIRARADAGETPGVRTVPTSSPDSDVTSFVVGNNLLWYEGSGGALHNLSLAADAAPVLTDVEQAWQTGESVAVIGRATADSPRTLYFLAGDGSGGVSVTPWQTIAPVHHDGSVGALGLDRGTVRFLNYLRGTGTLHSQDIGTALTPADGAPLTPAATSGSTGAGRFADGGDEGLAQLTTDPATGRDILTTADDPEGDIALPATDGRILDVSPQYVLYAGGGKQYVVDITAGKVVRELTAQAAVLDYGTLWTPSTTAGQVVATNLRTGKAVRTVETGGSCTPNDLRANGTLLYWSCAAQNKAGIKNLSYMDRTYPAPVGDVLLGDGFYGSYDPAKKSIRLTEVLNDATDSLGEITGVAATSAADTRGVTWTVDRRSNKVAYVDADSAVHVVGAYDYTWLASRLTAPDSTAPASFAAAGGAARWDGRWWLSKPAASWQVTLKSNTTGAVLRTWKGGPTRSAVRVSWDGKAQSGALVPNGAYTWTLTATPADGNGSALSASGTVKVTGAAAVPRDYAGSDGIGDLLTLTSSGALSIQKGDGRGGFSGKVTGSGWAASVRPVPFGDLDGDRCNDVLVRFADGTLRAYRPGCGRAVTPSTANTVLGTGFDQYDVLTSPGDVTGDGRADLLARNARTGAVYLYKATSSGKLAARVRLYADWSGYKKVVGAGDLDGDGRGDLLVQDKSNKLWRYSGTASGTFKARVKLFDNWGSSYNAVIGVGDITADGKADLVARDTSGALWRTDGTGKGSFGARTKIGTGWGTYKGLS
ncbi:FG-GAP-like repeat-containing protein [Streptomyces sp. NPDC048710]|uniref:FG-GAP-like repeat-containing protein n=1 Tax=Streptomyces sp. NPDC048710 TaxID=3365586 RepID=UPI00371DDE35